MRIAIIGQSKFSADTLKALHDEGFNICGAFCIEDKNGKPDDLAKEALKYEIPIFKIKKWRQGKLLIPEVFENYKSVGADLNVLPFCSQFIPMEIIQYPKNQSIIYHPSLLPNHRGASAINWTLMSGDKYGGFTIFWADDGLDTGPILLQKKTLIDSNDTVDSLYSRFLFPQGIKSLVEAVQLIQAGNAPSITQTEEGASYEPMWTKAEQAKVNWDQPAEIIHNFIRGSDKKPGAWTSFEGFEKPVTLYSSVLWMSHSVPKGHHVKLKDCSRPALIHADGILFFGNDNKMVNIRQISIEGKLLEANKFVEYAFTQDSNDNNDSGVSRTESEDSLCIEDENGYYKTLLLLWTNILNLSSDSINPDTDFFKNGADSMDVTRLVEEIKEAYGIEIPNESIYMNPEFKDFVKHVIEKIKRDDHGECDTLEFDPVVLNANNMELTFPHQLFINGKFVNAFNGAEYVTLNPSNEEAICYVAKATKEDVNSAVKAAHDAFYKGPWGRLNARERASLLFKLANLMEEHKEELATLESLDSGAVYTVAIKTHVGMSIETLRYFAGWCDKIQGNTIPINNAHPNYNLTLTKKEPIGVCGIITPWNYPLMMLVWKISPCLAAGNTVVIKPAQVSPLTALKFAELAYYAGIPSGVINIIPGSGSECGEALLNHPHVRKIGFTGSTEIGKHIMERCALTNLKKCSLELGGKSPLIIFADCDLEKATKLAVNSTMFNKGENCIAAGRIFIEESIYDTLLKNIVEAVGKIKVGEPFDRSTQHGPQNHLHHLEKLLEFVRRGVNEGAKLLHGGKRIARPGYFLEPTIFADVEDSMQIAKEESFGPIMVISKFKNGDIDGVIGRANKTEYGLASGVITNSIQKALYVSDKLQAGTVFINTYNKTDVAAPFGGIKESGFGKDLGEAALHEWMTVKTITIEY